MPRSTKGCGPRLTFGERRSAGHGRPAFRVPDTDSDQHQERAPMEASIAAAISMAAVEQSQGVPDRRPTTVIGRTLLIDGDYL